MKVLFSVRVHWKWTINYWADASTNPWTNPKTSMQVVYVKEESDVKEVTAGKESPYY